MGKVYPDTPLVEGAIVRVVDGDTVVAKVNGAHRKVRLIGINAPESVAKEAERNCEEGRMASRFMKELVVEGQSVWLQRDVSDEDEYGRLLRYVWIEQTDRPDSILEIQSKMLNAILVEAGYAEARRYEPDDSLYELFASLGMEAVSKCKGVSYRWSK